MESKKYGTDKKRYHIFYEHLTIYTKNAMFFMEASEIPNQTIRKEKRIELF